MELSALSEGLQALPLSLQLASGAAVIFLSLLILRVLSNAFPGAAPPVDEGLPFVGGLIKFSKVRCCLQLGWPPPPATFGCSPGSLCLPPHPCGPPFTAAFYLETVMLRRLSIFHLAAGLLLNEWVPAAAAAATAAG